LIYSVAHTTVYSYSRAVFLEPHYLRFYPRSDPAQKVISHELWIKPEPAGTSRGIDIWGNSLALAWFEGLHSGLEISSTCSVETLRINPFDYFLPAESLALPVQLAPGEQIDLKSSLTRSHLPGNKTEDPVQDLTRRLLEEARGSSTAFLQHLNSWIFENLKLVERPEPGIIPPDVLLERRCGSCRDLAGLFIETCRETGIPARFVSGYQEGDPDLHDAELHAWAEIYLPGPGWRGFDPSHGLAVADRHIALAAAPCRENTMPVSGSFRGTGALSSITHIVRMQTGK